MVQARKDRPTTIHASVVQIEGHGVLVRGPSGSGKSSLVLALLIAPGPGGRLVADDRAILTAEAGRLIAAAPAELAGLLEVRGQGIFRQPYVPQAEIVLVVDLEPADRCERMPEAAARVTEIDGVRVQRLVLPVGQADGWMRVLAALRFAAVPVEPE